MIPGPVTVVYACIPLNLVVWGRLFIRVEISFVLKFHLLKFHFC